jgi:hypothetical protein
MYRRMDDFVSFPEVLDLAPYMAPNRNDYKLSHTAQGPRAPYMDWISPDHGPSSEAVNYRLYGMSFCPAKSKHIADNLSGGSPPRNHGWRTLYRLLPRRPREDVWR